MYIDIYRRWENQKEWENEPHDDDCKCKWCDPEGYEIAESDYEDWKYRHSAGK